MTPDDVHPSIVILTVKNEKALLLLEEKANSRGIRTKKFFESDFSPTKSPDQVGHYSAFATEPLNNQQRKVFSNEKLLRHRFPKPFHSQMYYILESSEGSYYRWSGCREDFTYAAHNAQRFASKEEAKSAAQPDWNVIPLVAHYCLEGGAK